MGFVTINSGSNDDINDGITIAQDGTVTANAFNATTNNGGSGAITASSTITADSTVTTGGDPDVTDGLLLQL